MPALLPFTPAPAQLLAALDDIAYECEQVVGLCLYWIHQHTSGAGLAPQTREEILEANAYLEAFLLHVRVLVDFFERTTRQRRRNRELDDMLATDFGFATATVGIDESLRQRINQDVAHLSYSRTTRTDDARSWLPEAMARSLLEHCDSFAKHLLSGAATVVLTGDHRAHWGELREYVAALLRVPEA